MKCTVINVCVLLFLQLSGATVLGGSADATLSCRSPSGRTELNASIQDIDGLLTEATITVDGEATTFAYPDHCAAVFNAKHGVYTIVVDGAAAGRFFNGRHFCFMAIPTSFKSAGKTADGKAIWTFDAVLNCTEPRKGKSLLSTPEIELRCTLTYGI